MKDGPRKRGWIGIGVAALLLAGFSFAQFRGGGRSRSQYIDEEDPRAFYAARGIEFPDWEKNKEMPDDVFTFARLRYNSYNSRGWYGRGDKWLTDYPDSDLNFSYRLQELTSLEVDPDGKIVDIDAEQLAKYPFVYMIEPGDIYLTDEEASVLRDYMLNGGFIMVDDFWGQDEWDTFYRGLKQIFPDREPVDLPFNEPGVEDHPIFHFVFEMEEKPQVPSIGHAIGQRWGGETYEYRPEGGYRDPHYRGVYDDKQRLMMVICHNTDLGDGWEREGEDPWYFKEFSEKLAFPMGINIVFYALTH